MVLACFALLPNDDDNSALEEVADEVVDKRAALLDVRSVDFLLLLLEGFCAGAEVLLRKFADERLRPSALSVSFSLSASF